MRAIHWVGMLCWAFAGLLLSTTATGQDQIPWAASFEHASQAAAQTNRLVLLHFYSDDCPPCRRLEQNVFTQRHVSEAVTASFVPVKVHAARSPELVRRYQVKGWPTDVFVTPSGLPVFSAISPQQPDEYVAMVNQVALQSGVGGRQAGQPWGQTSRAGQAMIPAMAANHLAGRLPAGGDPAQQLQQRQWSPEAQQVTGAYAQQAGQAYQQFQPAAGTSAPYAQQPAYDPQHRVDARAQQLGDAARNTAQQWQQALEQSRQGQRSPLGTDSALAPAGSPYGAAGAAPGSAYVRNPVGTPPGSDLGAGLHYGPSPAAAGAATQGAPTAAPPLLPTENGWIAAQSPAQHSPAPQFSAPQAEVRPGVSPSIYGPPSFEQAAGLAQSPPGAQSPPARRSVGDIASSAAVSSGATVADPSPAAAPPRGNQSGLVPASQAPPVALEGFCPVTLLEAMEGQGAASSAWKKGDRQFGAIHRGKTYLFASQAAQQKFLADPDAYSPVLAGCDPVRYAQSGELVEGKRAYGLVYGRRIFLFADEASLKNFDQTPAAFAETAHQAMLRSETGTMYR